MSGGHLPGRRAFIVEKTRAYEIIKFYRKIINKALIPLVEIQTKWEKRKSHIYLGSYSNSDKNPKAALGLMFGFSEGNNIRKVI